MATEDPVVTDPEHYRTVFKNEYVRVLEYHDEPGDQTAQRHTGRNIGTTPTHTMLVELKGPAAGIPTEGMLGPDVP